MQFAYSLGIQANEPNNPLKRDMFWKTVFEKKSFFKPGSVNCKTDEAGVSWSISSTDLHLLSSKQNVFVRFSVSFRK